MGLKVWFPFTDGEIRNQGSTNITAQATNVTVNNNGKLGKCCSFKDNGNASYLLLSKALFDNNTKEWSYACWLNPQDPGANYHCLFSNRTVTSETGIAIFVGTASSYAGQTFFDTGKRFSASITIPLNKWTHLAFTFKRGVEKKIYVNGVLAASTTDNSTAPSSANATNAMIGASQSANTTAGGNLMKGQLNDVRIYDHCLSVAEVKELAKGLIIHYKLDRPYNLENLITNELGIYNNYSSTVTASLVALSSNYRGHTIHRETMTPDSTRVSHFQGTLNSHGVRTGSGYTFKANTKYVYWVYFRPISHLDVRVGGVASNISGWTEIPPVPVGDGWYRVGQYRNGSVTTDKTDQIFTSFYTPTAAADVPIIIDWGPDFLLKGTQEIPNVELFGNNIVVDSSGYGYHGTVVGSLSSTNDSQRYLSSTSFNGTNACIKVPNITPSAITVSFWMKRGTDTGTRQFMYTAWSGVTCELTTGGAPTFAVNRSSYPTITGTAITVSSGWVHYCGTFDTTDGMRLYQNGELKASNSSLTAISWNITTNYIGFYSNNYYNGLLSDFRIYTTALSAEDVLELYRVNSRIDNQSHIHTFEFHENNEQIIQNNGAFESAYFSEFCPSLKYDKDVYVEPDGSKWVHIAHHNNPNTSGLFSTSDDFAHGVFYNDDKWYDADQVISSVSKYEFMVKQAATNTATETKFRWTQTANPLIATYDQATAVYNTTTGYTNSTYGGLCLHPGTQTHMKIVKETTTQWWGAFGATMKNSTGVPGHPTANVDITTGYMDLYVRIDNIDLNMGASFHKNGIINANQLIEI